MNNHEETALITRLADAIQRLCNGLASELATPAHMIAALELVETRLTLALSEDDGDAARALAANLFDVVAMQELEELAATELNAWASTSFDDVPLPHLVTDPTAEKPHD